MQDNDEWIMRALQCMGHALNKWTTCSRPAREYILLAACIAYFCACVVIGLTLCVDLSDVIIVGAFAFIVGFIGSLVLLRADVSVRATMDWNARVACASCIGAFVALYTIEGASLGYVVKICIASVVPFMHRYESKLNHYINYLMSYLFE